MDDKLARVRGIEIWMTNSPGFRGLRLGTEYKQFFLLLSAKLPFDISYFD